MSEPKLCPRRLTWVDKGGGMTSMDFMPCLKDGCALWSESFDKCSKAAEVDRLYEIQLLLENIGRAR